MRSLLTAVLLAFTALAAGTAHAEYRYAFDQSNYTTTPGGTVPVSIYLQETETSLLADAGLQGVGINVAWSGGPASMTAVTPNSAFSLYSDSSIESTYAYLTESALAGVKATETPEGSGIYKVLVGTFSFTAGATNGVTTLTTADIDPEYDGDTATAVYNNISTSLDTLIFNGTATITTIPEPSTFVLAGIAVLALFAFHRWGRMLVAV
jgi:hypothetical protein